MFPCAENRNHRKGHIRKQAFHSPGLFADRKQASNRGFDALQNFQDMPVQRFGFHRVERAARPREGVGDGGGGQSKDAVMSDKRGIRFLLWAFIIFY